jgi:peptidyl-prolyl cis-trans isomerase C
MRAVVEPAAETARREPAPTLDDEDMFIFSRHSDLDPAEKQFLQAANVFDRAGARVVAQALPPCTADGRVIDHEYSVHPPQLEASYAATVAALGERGALSEVFQSSHGFHVALLLEVTPERKPSKDERLAGMRDELLQVRAKRANRQLLERLRDEAGVSVPTNIDAILAQVAARAEVP